MLKTIFKICSNFSEKKIGLRKYSVFQEIPTFLVFYSHVDHIITSALKPD